MASMKPGRPVLAAIRNVLSARRAGIRLRSVPCTRPGIRPGGTSARSRGAFRWPVQDATRLSVLVPGDRSAWCPGPVTGAARNPVPAGWPSPITAAFGSPAPAITSSTAAIRTSFADGIRVHPREPGCRSSFTVIALAHLIMVESASLPSVFTGCASAASPPRQRRRRG